MSNRRRRVRSDNSDEDISPAQPGPWRARFRPHSAPSGSDMQSQLREEFTTQITNLQRSLREEFTNRQAQSETAIMTQMRDTLRTEMEANRRTTREELIELLRAPPENRTPPPIPDNPQNPIASASNNNNLPNAPNITTTPSVNSLNQNSRIKPDTYDGSTPWSRYQKHFEIAALHNEWSEQSKAAQLATCLRGKAQLVLDKLSNDDLKNYKKITEILNERFDEKHLSRMYFNELQARKRKKDEEFTKFAEEIERLVRLAYLDTPEEIRERVACLQFISGIENKKIEFSLRSERIECLQTAVERATELKAIQELMDSKTPSTISQPIRIPSNSRGHNGTYPPQRRNFPTSKAHIQCFQCHRFGHYSDECPSAKPNQTQNSTTPAKTTFSNHSNSNFRFNPYRKHNNFNSSHNGNNRKNFGNSNKQQNSNSTGSGN